MKRVFFFISNGGESSFFFQASPRYREQILWHYFRLARFIIKIEKHFMWKEYFHTKIYVTREKKSFYDDDENEESLDEKLLHELFPF